MATKTITLEIDAYERLKEAKKTLRESFSEVVRRMNFSQRYLTGKQLLTMRRASGRMFSEKDCDAIDRLNAEDTPPSIP